MTSPFVCEIRTFCFNFAPRGWAFCDGQILPIAQNTAVFSLLGTMYGGNGQSTFALPDLQGRVPINFGQGPGLNNYNLGEFGGVDTVSLLVSEMPAHNHSFSGTSASANDKRPKTGSALAQTTKTGPISPGDNYYAVPGALASLNSGTVAAAGASLPHNNLQPYLTLNFCIALQGVFPPRP